FFLFGCAVFLVLGFSVGLTARVPMIDFKPIYLSARCLIEHGDPYSESDMTRVYQAQKSIPYANTEVMREAGTRIIYLPTVFLIAVPFAILPWNAAHVLWMMLVVGSILVAAFLMWSTAADYAPIISGILTGLFIANSEVLIVLTNAAGVAVGLCVVAVWCLLRERFVAAGVLCLAISLAIKPQDGGLVWLYFFLAGGLYRKRALQTLAATLAIGLPGVLWVSLAVPNWITEWRANILAFSTNGGLVDPARGGRNVAETLVNLQRVTCALWSDPHIYNAAAYLFCAPLLLAWMFFVLCSKPSPASAWLALAAIAPLSLLPVYHHIYDAKLLLLTVPACAMLWKKGGSTAKLALLVNVAALALAGDLSFALLLASARSLAGGLSGPMKVALEAMPIPLGLYILSMFYLWIFMRNYSTHDLAAGTTERSRVPSLQSECNP
ncbi:MAG: glycosyltransferase family 87 protein, partial [Terracidiphilus sp.]